jgi:hypothetical protein
MAESEPNIECSVIVNSHYACLRPYREIQMQMHMYLLQFRGLYLAIKKN